MGSIGVCQSSSQPFTMSDSRPWYCGDWLLESGEGLSTPRRAIQPETPLPAEQLHPRNAIWILVEGRLEACEPEEPGRLG